MKKVESIIKALRRELAWLLKQIDNWRPPADVTGRRNDLLSTCVAILTDSPGKYKKWLTRNEKRADLIRSDAKWWEKRAIVALTQLVELVISDLEACRPFMPRRACGCLVVAIGKAGTQSTKAATTAKAQQRQAREVELSRRIDHLKTRGKPQENTEQNRGVAL